MGAKRGGLTSQLPKALWRRAALYAMRGKARPIALVAVLPVALDEELKTHASNDWLMEETGLDLRSVQYGLDALKEAGLIKVEVRGPRRTITAVIPPEYANEKHAQIVHDSSAAEGEQFVHATQAREHEQFKRKARTSYSPIVGRSPPNPPSARLSEFQLSKQIADRATAEQWQPGTPPQWMADTDPPGGEAAAGAIGAAAAPYGLKAGVGGMGAGTPARSNRRMSRRGPS